MRILFTLITPVIISITLVIMSFSASQAFSLPFLGGDKHKDTQGLVTAVSEQLGDVESLVFYVLVLSVLTFLLTLWNAFRSRGGAVTINTGGKQANE